MNNKWVGPAALFSAGFASICCIGPILLTGLGLGSLGLAAGLAQYRPVFLAVTAAVLGAGFYFAYRKRSVVCADGSCEVRSGGRAMKAGLWGLTVLTLALATFPTWSARLLAQGAAAAPAAPAGAKTLALKVSGMTCEACAVSISKSVENVPGVYSARVDFSGGRAEIKTKDGVSAKDLLRAVEAAGYEAEVIKGRVDGSS